MKADVAPGKYVLAVSGGVDSMALLDLLAKKTGVELVVAHFNHGIRPDAKKDELLVLATAKKYNLPYEVGRGRLGSKASEDTARRPRYEFLEKVRRKHSADGIITAHHQDDYLETALLNLLRGTGRRGLSSISNSHITRPLLNVPKTELIKYAKKHNIRWNEDSTNNDPKYARNTLRLQIMPKMTVKQRSELLKTLKTLEKTNLEIDNQIATYSQLKKQNELDRQFFTTLPTSVSDELLAFWLRANHLAEYDRKTIRRLSTALKTAKTGSKQPIYGGYHLSLAAKKAYLLHP